MAPKVVSVSSLCTLFILVALTYVIIPAQLCTASTTSDTPTVQRPSTIYYKTRLEQLKKMEESALKGWYDMVQKFLSLIKPDDEVLNVAIDYALDPKGPFTVPSAASILSKNSVFLVMVSIGLAYSIIMLLVGLFFLFCRCCGRCGAKDTQRQTRNMNCWRSTHKFCLVLMMAFLVVPISCMFIINEHMKESFPSIKSNASVVFPMITEFINNTEQEVNEIAEEQIEEVMRNVQNKDNFQKNFAGPLEDDISNSFTPDSLQDVKDFLTWLLAIKEDYIPEANITIHYISWDVEQLKNIVRNLTEETKKFKEHCTNNDNNICEIILEGLRVEDLDVSKIQREFNNKVNQLLQVNSDDLKTLLDKLQSNSLLKDTIARKSEDLEKFADDLKPQQENLLKKIKEEVKKYAANMRKFTSDNTKAVNYGLKYADSTENIRWWVMLGIAAVLSLPVALLLIGLVCGCCGYRKGYHPSKRSSTSNCGGLCLILAVYCFFFISWILMLVTVAAFVVGGNMQSFVCVPLYQQDFTLLDSIVDKCSGVYPDLQYVVPSKLLKNCQEDMSIFEALDLGILNKTNGNIVQDELKKKLKNDDVERSLRKSIASETKKIHNELDSFISSLNITQDRDFPRELQKNLDEVKRKIEGTRMQVDKALSSTNLNTELDSDLQKINKTAQSLWSTAVDLDYKLVNFSSSLQVLYADARNYMGRIVLVKQDLINVEQRVPELVHDRLFMYVAGVMDTDLREVLRDVGRCESVWLSFDMTRTVVCDFLVYPINGFWFGLGWILFFIVPTIIFAVKLSRHYLRMKYDDDLYRNDEAAVPLDDVCRTKPFSYTNPGNMSWLPQNYTVHPAMNNHIRQFDYK